jgi:hypothetical protein
MYARRRLAILSVSLLAAAMLWGCGSNGSGGSDVVVPSPENVQTLGIDNCLVCHFDDPGIGEPASSVGKVWVENVHGNPDLEPVNALMEASCLVCHDQLGDGQRLAAATNGVEPNRPVVGCESCHGGGSAHRGIGPLPFPNPDHERCGQCHNANYPHGNPEKENIVEDFRTSPHTRTLKPSVFIPGTAAVPALCAKCHSDEGAKLYRDVDGDHAALTAALPESLPALTGASSVECRTCHQAHQENQLLEAAGIGRSTQFNTCTNCHQLLEAGSAAKITAFHDPTADTINGDSAAIITDTHFDDPATGTTAAGTTVEGYVIRAALDSACADCHNPHRADNTVNQQWARSAHGGHIAEVKEAAEAAGGDVFSAGVTDASGIAWTHYNWDDNATRSSCQRCHTATGVSKFLANPDGYIAANNTFPHLSNWTAAGGSSQQELLYCWGCHSDSKGGLRNPGGITENYAAVVNAGTGTTGTVATVVYPDISGSNVCMACHLGREIGQNIKNTTDGVGTNIGDQAGMLSFINSHYLTAGATLFNQSGYEYAGLSYDDPAFFAHNQIGTAAEPGTGSNGPCVGCHMSSSEKHLFLPVAKDETTGAITAITSTVCIQCHTGQIALTPAELTEEEEFYHAALDALDAALAAKGIHFFNAFPYFFTQPNGQGGAFTNWESIYPGLPGTDVNWKNTMGAAFNLNLLEHDPGGYAHNRFYAKRLIFDAIDWIDNGALDGAIDLTAHPEAAVYLNAASPVSAVARP